jgi:hypothetical protein
MLRDVIATSTNQHQLKQDSHGVLLFFDNSRSKFLSATRQTYKFGIDHRSISNDRWLYAVDKIVTNVTGYRIPRNATITAITIQSQNITGSTTFNIRRNDNPTNISSTALSAAGITSDDLNVDVDKDDWLQLFMSVSSGNISNPLFVLELAWRD